jgi:hypothetical protein
VTTSPLFFYFSFNHPWYYANDNQSAHALATMHSPFLSAPLTTPEDKKKTPAPDG